MQIINYSSSYAKEIADLYHASVHAIDPSIYTEDEKEAWASTPPDYISWEKRLDEKKPYLGIIEGQVAGFIELEDDGHINCTYTHPDFQGKGVASALYKHIETKANSTDLKRLYVEASHIAVPFFKSKGFSIIQKNEIPLKGQILINFTMEKHIS
ncbi:GNAT family N-acetyltransferase [Curvivirga sp.]|uniref:GNAT family N-acetyltransferase n=1 Tax=Curvivirga sp. TaxID=2856848 RepID=UPI003B5CAF5E